MLTEKNAPSFNPGALSDFYAAVQQAIADYLGDYVSTCIPVEVVSIPVDTETGEPNNQLVNVQPVLQNTMMNGTVLPITSNDTYYNIPMMTLFGNQCEISFQVSPGDKGLLIASKYDISNYKNIHAATDKPTLRTFSFSDGFFLPLDFQQKQNGIILRNGETVLNILPESITINTKSIDVTAQTATVKAEETVTIETQTATITAQAVNLGGEAGVGIARIGDQVSVDVQAGSSAGTWTGTITSGSTVSKSI